MVYQFIIILSLRIDLFGGQSPIFRHFDERAPFPGLQIRPRQQDFIRAGHPPL